MAGYIEILDSVMSQLFLPHKWTRL